MEGGRGETFRRETDTVNVSECLGWSPGRCYPRDGGGSKSTLIIVMIE